MDPTPTPTTAPPDEDFLAGLEEQLEAARAVMLADRRGVVVSIEQLEQLLVEARRVPILDQVIVKLDEARPFLLDRELAEYDRIVKDAAARRERHLTVARDRCANPAAAAGRVEVPR